MSTSKFPTDRIVFFSDAVFAIAITLLVIEIKVPSHEAIHQLGVWAALFDMIPLFIGFFVSFLVTALFWRAHLVLCHFVKEFDDKLLWLNIWLLLFVAFMPFSTAFYSEYFSADNAFIFYCVNVSVIGFFVFLITNYVIKKENLTEILGRQKTSWMKVRSLIVPAVFILCIIITLFSPLLGRLGPMLIFVFLRTGEWMHRRKLRKSVQPV